MGATRIFRLLAIVGISVAWLESGSHTNAMSPQWKWYFKHGEDLHEYGKPGPDLIPVAIIGTVVEKPGIYWCSGNLEDLLGRPPTNFTKNLPLERHLISKDGTAVFFKYSDREWKAFKEGSFIQLRPGLGTLSPYDVLVFSFALDLVGAVGASVVRSANFGRVNR